MTQTISSQCLISKNSFSDLLIVQYNNTSKIFLYNINNWFVCLCSSIIYVVLQGGPKKMSHLMEKSSCICRLIPLLSEKVGHFFVVHSVVTRQGNPHLRPPVFTETYPTSAVRDCYAKLFFLCQGAGNVCFVLIFLVATIATSCL